MLLSCWRKLLVLFLCWITLTSNNSRGVEGFRLPLLAEELGCSPTLAYLFGLDDVEDAYFDPLGFATDENFARLREAELKHGRVSMMAVVATTLPPLVKQDVDWIPNDYPFGIIKNLSSLTLMDVIKVVSICAFLETAVFVQKSPKDMPGDYGTGYFGIRNKGAHERSLIVELENGRLAMMALAGQLTAELVTGKVWIEQWEDVSDVFSSLFASD